MLNDYFLSLAPMTHAYNPSYLGGVDQEDHSSWPAQAKSSQDLISIGKKLGIVAHVCYPNYCRKNKIKRSRYSQPGKKARPYCQNNQSKKSWQSG
jgi:hypothetical protein